MKTSLLLLGLAAAGLLWPSALSAYQDPPGDKKPTVLVRDGQFVVRFEGVHFFSAPSEENAFEIVFSPEGKLITPRREIDFDFYADDRPNAPLKIYPPRVEFRSQSGAESQSINPPTNEETKKVRVKHRAVLVEYPNDYTKRTESALPLAVSGHRVSSEETTLRGDQTAFAWTDVREYQANEVRLKFSIVSKIGFKEGITVDLGRATAYASTPRLTPPIWANGRWWIAWVRLTDVPSSANEEQAKVTLTSIEPQSQRVEHKEIQSLCYWTSYISMQVIQDRLCLAWNGPMMTPPYYSQIYMAFEKLPQ